MFSAYKTESGSVLDQYIWRMQKPRFTNESSVELGGELIRELVNQWVSEILWIHISSIQ